MELNGIGSSYMDYMASSAKNASADKIQNSLKTDYSNASDDELMKVCKEFEAYFLEQVFKEMVKTIPGTDEKSGANQSLVDFYKDSMIQNLAAQSTEQNSLGLAQSMYEQMKRNYAGSDIGEKIPEAKNE